jgi:hypothetical protein
MSIKEVEAEADIEAVVRRLSGDRQEAATEV